MKYKKKGVACPECASSDAFFPVDIFDDGTKNDDEKVGKCFSCGNFFPPKREKNEDLSLLYQLKKKKDTEEFSHNKEDFKKWTKYPTADNLRIELYKRFPKIKEFFDKYQVFSFKNNDTIYTAFPHISLRGEIKGIKYFSFATNCHTDYYSDGDKKRKKIGWVHSLHKLVPENQIFKDCFFGENLIFSEKSEYKYIGVVESEKSAIVANFFLGQDWLFLATGSKSNIKNLVYKGIKEKNVILFPDADGFKEWSSFCNENKKDFPLMVCLEIQGINKKMDICDVILEGDENEKKQLKNQIDAFIFRAFLKNSTELEKIKAINFYDSILSKLLTSRDLEDELSFIENFDATIEKEKTNNFFRQNGERVSFYSFYEKNGKLDRFFYLLKTKHIPLYEDIKDFSPTLSEEEFLQLLQKFTPLFFKDLIYNTLTNKFESKDNNLYSGNFEIKTHIRQCLKMLEISNINEKKIKILNPQTENIYNKFIDEIENMPCDKIMFEKSIGEYEEILSRGRHFFDEKKITTLREMEAYFQEALHSLFAISDFDIAQLLFFTASTIRKKFFNEYQRGIMLYLSGDAGIGKDTFFPSLICGQYIIGKNDICFSNSSKVNGFNTLTEAQAKKILVQVISDNLAATNETNINEITSPITVINNKGIQQKVIKNTFNLISTANFQRQIFNKQIDTNALCRRVVFVDVKFLNGLGSTDYKNFYIQHGQKFFDFYAAWFYFCWQIGENQEIMMDIENSIFAHNIVKVNELKYLSNDDYIIIDNFLDYLERNGNEMGGVTEINGYFRIENCKLSLFSPKKEVPAKYIKDILSTVFPSIVFDKVVKVNYTSRRVITLKIEEIENFKKGTTPNNKNLLQRQEITFLQKI